MKLTSLLLATLFIANLSYASDPLTIVKTQTFEISRCRDVYSPVSLFTTIECHGFDSDIKSHTLQFEVYMNSEYKVTYSDKYGKVFQIVSKKESFRELYQAVKNSSSSNKTPIRVNELANGFTIELDR